jgi:transcriptional antiterminator RfaH
MNQPFRSPDSTPDDTAPTDRWYLAYTKPRQEQIALSNLELQHFNAYLPLYKKFKPSPQGPVALFEPMFPRYIFFRPSKPEQSISTVRSTKGITTIVRFGFEPAVMPDALVQCIRQLEQDRSQATLQEISNLKAGQTVRLQHTALGGIEGLIQSVSTKRVAVLLEILGRPTLVQVEHHQVAVQS